MENIEQLVATLSKDVAPVKPAPHPYVLSLKWLSIASVYLIASLAFSGLRPDLANALQNPWFAAEIVLLLIMFITAAIATAVLSFPDMHQKHNMAYGPLWVVGMLVLVMLFAWRADAPTTPLPMHSFECMISITLFSLLPSVATFYALRKLASTHQRLSSSIAVLFAFSTGALWLRLHEQTDSIIHVIEWHYLPILAFSVLGLWLGKVLLKW
ncbi:MAG: DUF1109 domain-containing protein [Gallionella sp.]